MSSTYKTDYLHLNSWIGSDKPERLDFNYDNGVIDEAIATHNSDAVVHITAQERELWNNNTFSFTYYGNGAQTRTLTPDCPFDPVLAVVLADSYPASVINFDNKTVRNYYAVAAKGNGMMGIVLNNNGTLTVTQSPSETLTYTYSAFNELGVAYTVFLFRE